MFQIAMTGFGGVERLQPQDRPDLVPLPGRIVVDNRAAGVNFVDVLARRGIWPDLALPYVPGVEGSGVIAAVGADVADLAPGMRVAWFGTLAGGGYAGRVAVPAAHVVALPDAVPFTTAAAVPVTYVTARHMLDTLARARAGDVVLVRAAAGGVGTALLQLARLKGLQAIGVAGSGKARHMLANGAALALDHGADDVPARVRGFAGDHGLAATFNPVGGATIAEDAALLRPFGQVIAFGMLGGLPEDRIGPALFSHFNRSIGLRLSDIYAFHQADPAGMRRMLSGLLDDVAAGRLSPQVEVMPLGQAAEAQARLESGATTGKLVLSI